MKAGSSKVPFDMSSVAAKKVGATKKPGQPAVAKKVERKKRVPKQAVAKKVAVKKPAPRAFVEPQTRRATPAAKPQPRSKALETAGSPREVAASAIKRSWADVVRMANGPEGEVKVSSHGHPQVYVISPERHAALVEAERSQARLKSEALETLRKEFDLHLASLRAPNAGEKLRAAFEKPVRLKGSVKAGATH
jgi:PHD/YefM family antitoxin component YafN of YafNO toxin-antitoxin module